jgi:hypothetical protein
MKMELAATDERNAHEDFARMEVRQRQEEDQAHLQDSLGAVRVITS